MDVLDDNGINCECVVINEGDGLLEIKNITAVPEYKAKGYAKMLIDFIVQKYRKKYAVLQVGTGDSPATIPFYGKCVFVRSHVIPDFFTDNYDHSIIENGVQLVDMVCISSFLNCTVEAKYPPCAADDLFRVSLAFVSLGTAS